MLNFRNHIYAVSHTAVCGFIILPVRSMPKHNEMKHMMLPFEPKENSLAEREKSNFFWKLQKTALKKCLLKKIKYLILKNILID